MANKTMSLVELFHKLDVTKDVDFLREGVRALAQALMEVEATVKAGQAGTSARRTGKSIVTATVNV